MMKLKRILSTLLVACMIFGMLPATTFALDTSALANYEGAEGYHLFTDLPTAENPTTTVPLYYGAVVSGVFYGMNSNASSNAFTTTTDAAAQFPFTLLYGGSNETHGNYYYLTYNNNGTQYAIARNGAYYTQNKILDTGAPTNGWAAKHMFYYDETQMFFFNFSDAANTASYKGMKLSTSSYKLFVETQANLGKESTAYKTARFYTVCTSDGKAGMNETHQWSGSCIYEGCETKYDYKERVNIIDPAVYHKFDAANLPTVEGETVDGLYLGAAFEENGTFYGLSSTAKTGNDGTTKYFETSDDITKQCTVSVRYAGNDETYGDYYNLIFNLPEGTAYVLHYANGVFGQNKLTDGLPSGGFAAKHKVYFDADYEFFYVIIETDDGVAKKGLKISASSHNIFKADVPTELQKVEEGYSPIRLFEACTSDNVAGTDDINIWSGSCDCGYLFDYQVKPTPDSYHISAVLPTAENPEITGLSLGGIVNGTFYGLNATSVVGENNVRYFTTATEATEQCIITVQYAGNDEVYGDYYHVIFRIPGGDSYALAYAGGYFAQNKLTDGKPSGDWDAKHMMFFDAEGQFFYYILETETELVKKGLKISNTSQNLFTEKVENLKVENSAYIPVRLHVPCISNEVPGKCAEGRYTGVCECGYKFDLTAIDALQLPEGHHAFTQLPTAENPETTETIHMGIGLVTDGVPVFYGMSSSFRAEHDASTSTEASKLYNFRVIYGGEDETYGTYYYLVYDNLNGNEYAVTYAGGYLSQNQIQETGEPKDGWQTKHRMFFDTDLQTFYFRAPADMNVMKTFKISTSSYNLFTEKVENLKADNEIYTIRPYVVCYSNNVPGFDDTHHWGGTCSCGLKMDYEENYVVETREPQANTPYFWGMTQMDIDGQPCYFFNGEVVGTNLNVVKNDMLGSTPIYVEVVDGGYVLYFMGAEDAKQYIWYGINDTNDGKRHFEFVADAAAATVFGWNADIKGFTLTLNDNEYYIGNYSDLNGDGSVKTAYTKISAAMLARFDHETNKDHTFVANLYLQHMAHEDNDNWYYDAEKHWTGCFCGKVNAEAHNFTSWSVSIDGTGTMKRSCECGYEEETEADANLPAFRGASVSLHSSVALNFLVSFSGTSYTKPYMVFEMQGNKTTVTNMTAKGEDFVFTFDGLAPDQMGEVVKATFYATAKDGTPFAMSTEYSVAEYCYTLLRTSGTDATLKKLLVETLNFGAAAQQYRNNEVAAEDLVNADLTDAERALGSTGALRNLTSYRDFGTGSFPVQWFGVSLLMGDNVGMRVYFQAESIEGLTMKAVTADNEWTFTEFGTKDGMFYLDFYKLNPAQMGEKVSFTLYNGETAVSTTAQYSIESYADVWLKKESADSKLGALVTAMIRYGDAATAYTKLDKRTVNKTETLAQGVTKYSITYDVFGERTQAYVIVVEKDAAATLMVAAAPWDETNNADNPAPVYTPFEFRKQLKAQGHNVLAITNGGFFQMSAKSNLPWGMQIIDGVVKKEPSKDSLAYSNNWFGITKDGQYVISDTDGYNNTYKDNILYGIGGGKRLMINGEIQAGTSKADDYRTCVGITENGDLILVCTGPCYYEMAVRVFTDLNMGVKEILNMDGGGSTTLYTTDSTWQSRYDICGDGYFPRAVADAIAIVAK